MQLKDNELKHFELLRTASVSPVVVILLLIHMILFTLDALSQGTVVLYAMSQCIIYDAITRFKLK